MKCVGEPIGRDQDAKGHFDRDALRRRAEGPLQDKPSLENKWNQAEGLRIHLFTGSSRAFKFARQLLSYVEI